MYGGHYMPFYCNGKLVPTTKTIDELAADARRKTSS
jgi:hypothetical protein